MCSPGFTAIFPQDFRRVSELTQKLHTSSAKALVCDAFTGTFNNRAAQRGFHINAQPPQTPPKGLNKSSLFQSPFTALGATACRA